MKRALVISLFCVLALGIGVAAQSFTGSWTTDMVFDPTPLDITSLTSILYVDYAISGWTFGFNAFVNSAELFDLNFDMAGTLGAFSFWSFLDFGNPSVQTPTFNSWENVVSVSIAGVELYGVFVLQEGTAALGSGWAVGAHGTAGLVEIWAEADFNLTGRLGTIEYYGFYKAYDWETYYHCAVGWDSGAWSIVADTCTPAFSNLDIIIYAPLTCLDFKVSVNFDCTNGFDYVQFDLDDIDLGAGWFQLDDLTIKFTAHSKTVTSDFTLTFGSAVCVTPYFDLIQDGIATIQGIELDALLLSYTYNGVTIKAGEFFPTAGQYWAGFAKSGSLSYYGGSCIVADANEFVGVYFDGDSCCGGLTSASVVMFFDGIMTSGGTSSSTGIFDFILVVANVEVGIGTGFSIRGGMEVSDDALETLSLGFTFSF